MARSMVKASKFGLMVHAMMECGKMIKQMVKEFWCTQMEMFMKVVG
jgi:hypothetical protein